MDVAPAAESNRMPGGDPSRHPCFDPKARHAWARVHLPVAPRCNVSCNFCNRRYDCSNESRPGVTSVVLSPEQSLAYLDDLVTRRSDVSVVGIAGPGDPMANAEATLATLRGVRLRHPELLLCLATNGLALAAHVPELERLRLSHLTITINTLRPSTGSRIYAWVKDGERVLRGEEGASLLLERQMAALEALRSTGILIKVNAIVIPRINDDEIPEIAAEASRRGAHLFNCLPLIPTPGTKFGAFPAPSADSLSRLREAAGRFLPLMDHCSRCRADACGLLNEGTAERSLVALRAAAALPGRPPRRNIAVATREGWLINGHLGASETVTVYEPDGQGYRLLERRVMPERGQGRERWRSLAQHLTDCRILLAGGVGPTPRHTLEEAGIEVLEAEGLIEDALGPLFHMQPLSAQMAKRFAGCGGGCGGTGQGCG
jgi:nitrogen fixation protein NifB